MAWFRQFAGTIPAKDFNPKVGGSNGLPLES